MFNVSTHTAAAVDFAVKETSKLEKVSASVTVAMTRIFAAFVVADHSLSIKAVSTLVGEKVPLSKVAGVASKAKSEARAYFDDTANANAIRTAIPNPEAMDPDAFNVALNAYCAGISPRKWAEAKKAAEKAAATTQAADVAATQRALGDDEEAEIETSATTPAGDPVLALQTRILADIATLTAMEQSEAVLDALYAIALATGVIADTAEVAEAA